jgi:general secretion pathway protein I
MRRGATAAAVVDPSELSGSPLEHSLRSRSGLASLARCHTDHEGNDKRSRLRSGFTLLEVMVAVAILALALTAIFASQAGSIKVAHRARKTTMAALLARCKMGEIEEQIFEEGFPALELSGEDGCCEDAEVDGFTCDWVVESVVLPEPGLGEDEEDPMAAAAGAAGAEGEPPTAESVEAMLGGDAAGGMGGDMLTEMALSYAYPILKPALEQQVRRAKVTVFWHEGDREHSFDVVQYLVAEPGQAGPPDDGTGTGTGTGTGDQGP